MPHNATETGPGKQPHEHRASTGTGDESHRIPPVAAAATSARFPTAIAQSGFASGRKPMRRPIALAASRLTRPTYQHIRTFVCIKHPRGAKLRTSSRAANGKCPRSSPDVSPLLDLKVVIPGSSAALQIPATRTRRPMTGSCKDRADTCACPQPTRICQGLSQQTGDQQRSQAYSLPHQVAPVNPSYHAPDSEIELATLLRAPP